MATNKFATMVHKKTNRLTLILVYALLEWTLIFLLLLNSLFSYLIIKFADYFGLKRPCILCSSLDRFLGSESEETSYKDIVCEAHAVEISKLGYCLNHRKLVESQDTCEDCSSSLGIELTDALGKFDFLRGMKQFGVIQDGGDGEARTKCSCCGVNENRKACFLVKKPSLGVMDYIHMGNLDLTTENKVEGGFYEVDQPDQSRSQTANDDEEKRVGHMVSDTLEQENCSACGSDSKNIANCENEKLDTVGQKEKEDAKENDAKAPEEDFFSKQDQAVLQSNCREDKSPEILPQHLEFLVDHADNRLIPVELINAAMAENRSQYRYKEDNEDFILDFDLHGEAQVDTVTNKRCDTQERVPLFSFQGSEEEGHRGDGFEIMNLKEKESFSALPTLDADRVFVKQESVEADVSQATETQANNVDDAQASAAEPGKMDSRNCQGNNDVSKMRSDDDGDAEVSIGTEIPDHEHMEETEAQESSRAYGCQNEDPSTSASTQIDDTKRSKQYEQEMVEFNSLSVETSEQSAEKKLPQGLNELMVKREKEKQELKRELEIYRKKVQGYEAKEKIMALGSKDSGTRSRTSSTSCSNAEDSDGLSVDLNHEAKDDVYGCHQESSNQKTPIDAVLCLEESLTDLEGEKLSILEQLKGLEEKLMMLSDEDEYFKDVKAIRHYHEENGNGHDKHLDYCIETKGCGNGLKEMNGKHKDGRIFSSNAKRLLPLFDAIETGNGSTNGHEHGYELVSPGKSSVIQFERQNKMLVVEEEVDNVYARLQALEADREFLKHCINSLRKGDKGLDLLQEILQHLRDLRSVELRVRSMVDGPAQ